MKFSNNSIKKIEKKLKTQLESEQDDKKRKEIKQSLLILYAKQKKGEKIMQGG